MKNWMRVRLLAVFILFILGCLFAGCHNVNALPSLPANALADPNVHCEEEPGAYLKLGTFDLGVGYAVAFDTYSGPDNDASGTLISFKGYPFGRWYAPPRANVMNQATHWSETDFYEVPKTDWHNRLSMFYGTSVGDFEGGGLDANVQAVGVGFDITPEIAILAGWAFYNGSNEDDTDNGFLLGISLNLYAFKNILKLASEF